jgi:menaquinone-dependent protoporphyrinogen oxidase
VVLGDAKARGLVVEYKCSTQSQPPARPDARRIRTDCGGDSNLNGRILAAYATQSGTTSEVAQAIGQSLRSKGAAVDVKPVKSATSLEGYCAVVVGSGIRYGRWLPAAVEFVKNNRARLSQIPTAFFTVHILNIDDSPASQARREAYTAPVRQVLTPQAEMFFAGRIDFSKLSLLEVILSKALNVQEQDLRDWSKIRGWAEGLSPLLLDTAR